MPQQSRKKLRVAANLGFDFEGERRLWVDVVMVNITVGRNQDKLGLGPRDRESHSCFVIKQ